MTIQTESIVNKQSTFTADISNIVINGAKSRYLEGITVMINALQAGATVPTVANILGSMNPVTVDIGGTDEVRSRLVDIFALDSLWLGQSPLTKISGGDNETAWVGGIWIPCWFPKVPQDTKFGATFNAVTDADNTQATVTANMLDGVPRRSALHYTEFQKNTSGTADTSFGNWDQDIDLVGNLIGVLFFQTVTSGAGVAITAQSLREIRIIVDGVNKMHYGLNEIMGIPNARGQAQQYLPIQDSPDDASIQDNYTWLPMIEPIPRGSKVRIEAMAGVDASAVRTLPIQAIPF